MFMKFLKDEEHQGKTVRLRERMGASVRLLRMLPLLSMALVFLLVLGWLVQAEAETFAYVATSSGTVKVIRVSDNTIVTTFGVGLDPHGVAVTPDGAFIYVANKGSNSVSVIRTSDWRPVAAISVEGGPHGIAITPDGAFAYVTEWSGYSVSIIRTADKKVVATVPMGTVSREVAITPDGAFAYVANWGGSTYVKVIRTTDNTVVDTINVQSIGVAITPDGDLAYVAGGEHVSVIHIPDNMVVATVPVGSGAIGIAITPDGVSAYVANSASHNVSVLQNMVVVATVTVGTTPLGIAITPDGAFAYVTNQGTNNVSVIRTSDNTVVATVPMGSSASGVAIGPAPPVPFATLSLNAASFHVGDPLQLDLRLVTGSTSPRGGLYAFEIKWWVETPADQFSLLNPPWPGIAISLLPSFDQTFRILDLSVPDVPLGQYHFGVRLLDLANGRTLGTSIVPFEVVVP